LHAIGQTLEQPKGPAHRLLDPADRISEVLFGLIMVLTTTGTLSVFTAGRADVKTMIIGALGCNLAWGIIDAGIYLMGILDERGRNFLMVRAAWHAADTSDATQLIKEALPEPLANVVSDTDLEAMRQKLRRLPDAPVPAGLSRNDALSGLAICFWVLLSTFPVVIPFLFINDVHLALRTSNAIAIAMLFMCGYAFAKCIGRAPWATGLLMVAVGCALVGVAITLGG
jgi:VIT family